MPRLFTAIELSEPIKLKLADCCPPAVLGLRPVNTQQIHLTLHFLGEADETDVTAALDAVSISPFTMTIQGVGRFQMRSRQSILWAGVQPTPQLQALHADIAILLEQIGFKKESRPYKPHITLARCKSRVPRRVIDRFLTRNEELYLPDIPVKGFTLFASILTPNGPKYDRIKQFGHATA